MEELLQNSHLSPLKRRAFQRFLHSTFDFFQAESHRDVSLIDAAPVELFTRMQSLVGALASLLIKEEEDITLDEEGTNDDSEHESEFSDEDAKPAMYGTRSMSHRSIYSSRSSQSSIGQAGSSVQSPSFRSRMLPHFDESKFVHSPSMKADHSISGRPKSVYSLRSQDHMHVVQSPYRSPYPSSYRRASDRSFTEYDDTIRSPQSTANGSFGSSTKKRYSTRF